tara:strand:+ start:458 stop:589 length:132 start_codon:yes stop_codon:yes gene_type:complete
MKKRKLNSKNPKYWAKSKEKEVKQRHELICTVKGVKVYATFTD